MRSTDVFAPLDAAQHACNRCPAYPDAICNVLTRGQLAALGSLMHVKPLKAGGTLYHEGDPARAVFTVTRGMLMLYKLLDDRRQVTGFALPGNLVGLGDKDRYVHSVQAIGEGEVCRWDQQRFCVALDCFPPMKHAVLERTMHELALAQQHLVLLGRKTARERLVSFLLALAARTANDAEGLLPLPMSRADIADHLGLTVETVSRTFTALRKAGLIDLGDKRGVRLLAPDRLRSAVEA